MALAYRPGEEDRLFRLADRQGKKGRIPKKAWPKIGRAFNKEAKQAGTPERTWQSLRDRYFRHVKARRQERPHARDGSRRWESFKVWGDRFFAGVNAAKVRGLDEEVKRLRRQVRAEKSRADVAEAQFRRVAGAITAAQQRARGAAVVHSTKE